ncbi:hypothetical protein AAHB33_13475 [Paenarthrobacter sp. S56]|uniref:hypothetical protein n=1 Tax=Paenarthrobacter sp. S56 TaxID=3138179 RepID=UPI00321B5E33
MRTTQTIASLARTIAVGGAIAIVAAGCSGSGGNPNPSSPLTQGERDRDANHPEPHSNCVFQRPVTQFCPTSSSLEPGCHATPLQRIPRTSSSPP